MMKTIGLFALVAGLTLSGQASAHFSQVFGPLKALLISEAALQTAEVSVCTGRYASLLTPASILSLN